MKVKGDKFFPCKFIVLSILELNDGEIASDVHAQITNVFLEEVIDLFWIVVPCGNLKHLYL